MEFLQGLFKLEIAGCNEITEQGLWSSLHPRLASLTINDCINVADECVCAVTQLLPALYEFNLQVRQQQKSSGKKLAKHSFTGLSRHRFRSFVLQPKTDRDT